MLKFIQKLAGQDKASREALAYEEARSLLESQNTDARRTLASRTDLEPEMLYYLAGDDDTPTRALVAANPATPHQANVALADDEDRSVREELTGKIARLLPDLSQRETDALREQTIELIEKLARDQEPRVREILAEEIKNSTFAPQNVVQALARDTEISVCGPILRYSPLLSDADLIELIATTQVTGVIEAIAGREALSADVSDEVVASLDIPAVATLLANTSAQIRASTMEEIVKNAEEVSQWHGPISMRPDLSIRAVRRIAQFVGRDLLYGMADRLGLDDDTRRLLSGRLHDRLDETPVPDTAASALKIVQNAREQGRLDGGFISDAAEAGYTEQVTYALSMLSGLKAPEVQRILTSRNGKAITALVWRARLSMRVSVLIQTHVMHLKSSELLPARGGSEFPLTEEEMVRLLDYFGLAA
ncbi:hypothetical protein NBRC116588_16840 [Pyruvatibacter sp. HU-CL02332]|uniref:DUF2336 domain-containing protein n=1 Tax=Pyruvatibacter sp. HU-CL02332 TaxID=3127650 RepID=UPI003109BB10